MFNIAAFSTFHPQQWIFLCPLTGRSTCLHFFVRRSRFIRENRSEWWERELWLNPNDVGRHPSKRRNSSRSAQEPAACVLGGTAEGTWDVLTCHYAPEHTHKHTLISDQGQKTWLWTEVCSVGSCRFAPMHGFRLVVRWRGPNIIVVSGTRAAGMLRPPAAGV